MILRDARTLELALAPAAARRYLLGEAALAAWRTLTPGSEATQAPLVLETRQPRRIQLRQRARAYELIVDLRLEEAAGGHTRLRQEAWLELDGRRLKLLQPLLWRALQRSARAALQPAVAAAAALPLQGSAASHSDRAAAIA